MNVEGREGNPERKRRAPCSVLNHKPSDQEDEGEDAEGYPGCLLKWGRQGAVLTTIAFLASYFEPAQ